MLIRRALALALLPFAFLAGTASATELFQCAMDGFFKGRCCCPETWNEPASVPTFHRAPCCDVATLEVASQSPSPTSVSVAHVAPVVLVAPASPFSPSVPVDESDCRADSQRDVDATATGPPIYLRNSSLLC